MTETKIVTEAPLKPIKSLEDLEKMKKIWVQTPEEVGPKDDSLPK